MNKNEKKQKKEYISQFIDLANGRFKDTEIETLMDIVENRKEYNGQSKTFRNSFKDFSSDGYYRRTEEDTYTFKGDEEQVRIEHHYHYKDDDGQEEAFDTEYSTGRDILNNLHRALKRSK